MELMRALTSVRSTPHGRIDRRDSRNFGWRSTCGSLGMGNFFVLESVAATFVATRPTICPVPTNRVLWIFGENYSTELVKV